MNDVVQGTVSDASFTGGKVGVGSWNNAASFDNLVVTDGDAPGPSPGSTSIKGDVAQLEPGLNSKPGVLWFGGFEANPWTATFKPFEFLACGKHGDHVRRCRIQGEIPAG